MTIIELLICCALLLICLTEVYLLVAYGGLYLRTTNDVTTMQAQGLRALGVMAREIPDSDAYATTNQTLTGIYGLAFAYPRDPNTGLADYDSVGRLLWPEFICYYVDNSTQQLYRVVGANPAAPPPIDAPLAPNLEYVLALAGARTTVMATGVQSFIAGSPDASTVNVSLQCGLISGQGRYYGIQLHTIVYCRN